MNDKSTSRLAGEAMLAAVALYAAQTIRIAATRLGEALDREIERRKQ